MLTSMPEKPDSEYRRLCSQHNTPSVKVQIIGQSTMQRLAASFRRCPQPSTAVSMQRSSFVLKALDAPDFKRADMLWGAGLTRSSTVKPSFSCRYWETSS